MKVGVNINDKNILCFFYLFFLFYLLQGYHTTGHILNIILLKRDIDYRVWVWVDGCGTLCIKDRHPPILIYSVEKQRMKIQYYVRQLVEYRYIPADKNLRSIEKCFQIQHHALI